VRCGTGRSARGAGKRDAAGATSPAGFTLIEVAVATVIVGLALVSLMVAVQSNTRVNDAGRKLTVATFLADEIREWTVMLPFKDPDPADAGNPPGPDGSNPQVFVDDLDDLMNVTYCPPRDGTGQPIAGLPNWSQTIALTWVDPNSLSTPVTAGQSNVIRVDVDVACSGESVFATSWLVAWRTNP